jgi:PPOX class probable F420-dependent enzyme
MMRSDYRAMGAATRRLHALPTPARAGGPGPSAYHVPMTIPASVASLIERGPIAHVVTLNADGSPQVSLAWVGLEADEVVIGTLTDQAKLRSVRRDPRVAISMVSGERNAFGLNEYVVLHGRARLTEGGAAELLQRLARVYLGPDVRFPPMPNPPPGWVTHIEVERIVGSGPWSSDT